MKSLYKDTMDKIHLSEISEKRILNTLKSEMAASQAKKVKTRKYNVMRWGIAAAALVAVVLLVPQTRTVAMAAMQEIKEIFVFADGSEVVSIKTENETSFAIEIVPEESDYIEIEDERVYFVLEDIREDVTDIISEDTYFRYEKQLEDGSRSVIFIGGEAPEYGWVELLFDADGNYVANHMRVRENSAWVDEAMHAEGVPTGNPELDRELAK